MSFEYADYIEGMGLNDDSLNDWAGERQQIMPGEYKLEVFEAVVKPSRKGDPMLQVTIVVAEGEAKGRDMLLWFPLKPGSKFCREKLRTFVNTCGCPIDENGGFSAQAVIGAQFNGIVGHEEYETTGKDGNLIVRMGARLTKMWPIVAPKAAAPTKRATANGGAQARR